MLAPAPLGLLGLALPVLVKEAFAPGVATTVGLRDLFIVGVFYLFVAYLIAGIPSLIYAFVLERVFRAGVSPASWRSVGISSLLGAVAGIGMALVLKWPVEWETPAMLGAAGLTTGSTIGITIKRLSAVDDLHRPETTT